MVSTPTANHMRSTFALSLVLVLGCAAIALASAQSAAGGRAGNDGAAARGEDGKFFFSTAQPTYGQQPAYEQQPGYHKPAFLKPYVPDVKKEIVKKEIVIEKKEIIVKCPDCVCNCSNSQTCGDLACGDIKCGNQRCGGCGGCGGGHGDVTCVQPPHFFKNFSIQAIPLTDTNEDRLCTTTRNVCCAHGTKCNFGPIIDIDGNGKENNDVCVPNGIPNQCCVETDDGEGSSTKAIGFIAAKIPESNGTVGVDVTAPGAGLEQLKNLACYCCEGTLAIQHVANNMNITVDELKTATCQKKGFTGCNDTATSIKVRAADDPETFDVCALCPFTAEAHCKNETEACVFDVDCCEGLTCMDNNMCMIAPPPTDGRDATALEGDARKSDAAASRSQAAGRGAATPTAASRGSASSRTTGTAGGARDTAVTYDYVGGRGAVPSASAATARGGLQASTAAAAAGRGRAI